MRRKEHYVRWRAMEMVGQGRWKIGMHKRIWLDMGKIILGERDC